MTIRTGPRPKDIYIEAHDFQRLVIAAQTKSAEKVKERLWQLTNYVLPFVQAQNKGLEEHCRRVQDEKVAAEEEVVNMRSELFTANTDLTDQLQSKDGELATLRAELAEAREGERRCVSKALKAAETEVKKLRLLKADLPNAASEQENVSLLRVSIKSQKGANFIVVIRGQESYITHRRKQIAAFVGRWGSIWPFQRTRMNPNARYNWKKVRSAMLDKGVMMPMSLHGENGMVTRCKGPKPSAGTMLIYKVDRINRLKNTLEALNKGRPLDEEKGQPQLRDFMDMQREAQWNKN